MIINKIQSLYKKSYQTRKKLPATLEISPTTQTPTCDSTAVIPTLKKAKKISLHFLGGIYYLYCSITSIFPKKTAPTFHPLMRVLLYIYPIF